jgi:hypothetical protein
MKKAGLKAVKSFVDFPSMPKTGSEGEDGS